MALIGPPLPVIHAPDCSICPHSVWDGERLTCEPNDTDTAVTREEASRQQAIHGWRVKAKFDDEGFPCGAQKHGVCPGFPRSALAH